MNSLDIIEQVDLSRLRANAVLDPRAKSVFGQFMTPPSVCSFIASLFENRDGRHVRLLDPGAGVGSLTSAFLHCILGESSFRGEVTAEAFELDPALTPLLERNLALWAPLASERGTKFDWKVVEGDFIRYAVATLENELGYSDDLQGGYTHCIMNPPYKKLSSSSMQRALLRQIDMECNNLYSAFVGLAIRLLAPEGELVAIIPRSFCNGVYFKSFRKLLLDQVSIEQIHVFDSRTHAFKEDSVLQENVIIHATKMAQKDSVKISSSTDATFSEVTERVVAFEKVVRPKDRDRFIHIATSEFDERVVNAISVFTSTLADLEVEVSTGPVVDFRLKEHIEKDGRKGTCPLIYPVHFHEGNISWPRPEYKKPDSIVENDVTRRWLFPGGWYTLTRRLSAKEERRRIVAAVYNPQEYECENVGFENHVNVFHRRKAGLEDVVARGLAIYLNSTLVDLYFRQFSGHTQVNATDLRQLHYPDINTLRSWGNVRREGVYEQEEIDALVEAAIEKFISKEEAVNPVKLKKKIEEALQVLIAIDMPKGQQNERSALTLLALVDMKPERKWRNAKQPLMGITPIMEYAREYYGKNYAPNTRETVRRQTMHQFVSAGIAVPNPDGPGREVNSPKFVYQITPEALRLIRSFGSPAWNRNIEKYLKKKQSLAKRYAKERKMHMVPLAVNGAKQIYLSAGKHSILIREIIESFGPKFAPGAEVLYVGDTGAKLEHFEKDAFAELGLKFDSHGKFPDVVLYYRKKNWLLLIEAVTSHGPVDAKRHEELLDLFENTRAGLVFVTAFPNRQVMAKYIPEISWETEVWVAESPTHLIHFDGDKFLGPYK
ncbi:MAG: Eco57I restriction-modification methylase domain-containing protein [Planctomycetes bacterium]|nr:Eco57I restriction-modification methylase domain-containing protein [Planctomycetota bacterium]